MPSMTNDDTSFHWQLNGRITVIDNGAWFPRQHNFRELMAFNALSVIAFDPASRLADKKALEEIEEFQLFSHMTLGNGAPGTLFACLDANLSGTLEPLPPEKLPEQYRQGARLLSRLPINTVALNDIDGLNSIDWLLLDEFNDGLAVLENGQLALKDTLLVQVRIPLQPTHRNQPDFAQIIDWMAQHGMQLYRFNNADHYSHFSDKIELERQQATQMTGVDAIFIPDERCLAALTHERLYRLAFLLDAIYGIHDLTYKLLSHIDASMAKQYLLFREYIGRFQSEENSFTLTADYSPTPW